MVSCINWNSLYCFQHSFSLPTVHSVCFKENLIDLIVWKSIDRAEVLLITQRRKKRKEEAGAFLCDGTSEWATKDDKDVSPSPWSLWLSSLMKWAIYFPHPVIQPVICYSTHSTSEVADCIVEVSRSASDKHLLPPNSRRAFSCLPIAFIPHMCVWMCRS